MTYPPGLLCVVLTCQSFTGETGPKPAEPDSQTCAECRLHTRAHLGELAQLWNDLLTPTRVPTSGGRSSGGTERPQTLADPAVQARSQIQVALTAWCDFLNLGIGAHPAVRTMVVHLIAHLPSILASDEAARFCEAVDELWGAARRAAFPTGSTGQKLGDCPTCGTAVRSSTAHGPVRCRGCGQTRTVDEWQQVLVGDLQDQASATAADLASWLSKRHDRVVTEEALRLWASKGVRQRTADGGKETIRLTRVGTGHHGRALYSVADAARIGTGLYGPAKIGISA